MSDATGDASDGGGEPAATTGARVRRVDERLGLAVVRASLSGRTLVTYARDHVTVRTPSRPDYHDGNVIDLLAPPAPEELDGWLSRFDETIAVMGARRRRLRWETPLPKDASAEAPGVDPARSAALLARRLRLEATTVLLCDRLIAPPPAPGEPVPVAAPSAVPGGEVDRRWHAATVLYRYEAGEGPDDWREVDEDWVDWSVDVQRELATAGRATVWLTMRHGAPVARCTLAHDRQGLAVVEDLVVHPAHRGRGIAAALVHAAVGEHLRRDPHARVGVEVVPGSASERLHRRLGFVPHATVWAATGPDAEHGTASGRR